jgi:NAD(P)-dependent dehydrogenase (short-subunit alcohol dehydrogenase family)
MPGGRTSSATVLTSHRIGIQEEAPVSKAPRSLAGKVVAITGGARGIGRATAVALIAHGARVSIGDLDSDLAEQTAAQLGAETIGLRLDVADRASFERFLNQTEQRLGPLDVLINNAGIMPVGPFVQETDAMADRIIDVNLRGVIIGSRLALQRFLPKGRGHLVNIASSAGKIGVPGGATYSASKHAVFGLSEAIRGEVRRSGVDVSAVMPVGVDTELYSGLPQPRLFKTVQPEDVANAIVEALQSRRFEVYVPKSLGPTLRTRALLTTRIADLFGRVLRTDRVLLSADHTVRGAYEQRMAQAEAGAFAGPAAAMLQQERMPTARQPEPAARQPEPAARQAERTAR